VTVVFFDAMGCLSPEGLEAFATGQVGQAPPEVATHVASCGRCQERLLGRDRPAGARPAAPRPAWRSLSIVGGVLVVTLLLLGLTLGLLSGR
jgi:hypothetical protein